MRNILFIAIAIIFFRSAEVMAQIEITVSTDKTEYQVEEPIIINITAHNPTIDTLTLYFTSSCQSEYYIDDFYSASYHGCYAVLTQVTILPDSLYTWIWNHTPDYYRLEEGTHSITGEVIGYGLSDTITIFVQQTTDIGYESRSVPEVFHLFQNYPNPFNPSTKISYSIPRSDFVTLKVYDMLGRSIQTLVREFQKADTYSINFDASKFSSGIYFYGLQVGNDFVETKKMLLMK